MSKVRLIECVPNFSEGRDLQVIDAIAAEIESIPGVFLLDRHSDADHNRSVLTFLGEPQAVVAAAQRAVGAALERIDVTRHEGVHPRIGAVDVLPFVPYRGVTPQQAVALAHQAAARIHEAFGLPVYFYGEAADDQDRRRLAALRRDPSALAPDLGAAGTHPTGGAVAIGVRPFLVAYNVVLDTDDLSLARRIAREVRGASGGLPGVQALGFRLASRNRVQVSLNLIDLDATGIEAARCAVADRAAAAGAAVLETELVGLAPADAVARAAGLPAGCQIEQRLLDRLLEPGACALPLLERLASSDAAPGGGAVAALSGAMAAAQVAMLTHLVRSTAPWVGEIRALAESAWRWLYGLVERDQQAFRSLLEAYRLPKGDPGRPAAIEAGQQAASGPPLELMLQLHGLLALLGPLAEAAGRHVLPDLAIAVHTAIAAVEGAHGLVRINLEGCEQSAWARARAEHAGRLLAGCRDLADDLLARIASRG